MFHEISFMGNLKLKILKLIRVHEREFDFDLFYLISVIKKLLLVEIVSTAIPVTTFVSTLNENNKRIFALRFVLHVTPPVKHSRTQIRL